ncbi:MAG: HAD-IA family hydrolase [Patescibacteria group bacterium]|nr:HAD-IA family hydrolase [Patescibacteria group bacterium]MDE2438852.1 HAD-IA family hydrolase [Patescibacteria group bacterium]
MIKAVIFDLNGIFIQSPKLSDRFESDFHIPTTEFIPKLSEIMDNVRQPNAGAAFQYWKPALEEWNVHLTEQEFWDYWFGAETVSEQIVNFARELKNKGIRIFVLSNNFKERADYYGHYPWMHEVVDKAYFSWQTGFVKPDERAWILVCSENNLTPEECLYFDDQVKNTNAAEHVGMKAFMFTGENELRKTVNECLNEH